MRLYIQNTVSTSNFTLPVSVVLSLVVWLVVGVPADNYPHGGCGLWSLVPGLLTDGLLSVAIGASLLVLAAYLIIELNNKEVLLRIRSRLLSSMLLLLVSASAFLHQFQPALVLLVLVLLAFFYLFSTYQDGQSVKCSFVVYFLIALGSLLFPKFLLFLPLFWAFQIYLRSLSFRCFCAGLVGVALVYWIFFAAAEVAGMHNLFACHVKEIITFQRPDYSALTYCHIATALFCFVLFVLGVIDFIANSFMDKTRTRIIYNIFISFGFFSFIFICLQPLYFNQVFILLVLSCALVTGHFFAQTDTKYSNIVMIASIVLLAGVTVWNILSLG